MLLSNVPTDERIDFFHTCIDLVALDNVMKEELRWILFKESLGDNPDLSTVRLENGAQLAMFLDAVIYAQDTTKQAMLARLYHDEITTDIDLTAPDVYIDTTLEIGLKQIGI